MEEIWKDIQGYEGLYQASNHGKIRSLVANKLLRPGMHPKGYQMIWLGVRDKRKHGTLHRFIAETFIPNPENKPTVNHKDGNKLNNHVDNLEWATHKEQADHARENGLVTYRKKGWGVNSPEARRKISEANKGMKQTWRVKPIIRKDTGEEYPSIIGCSKSIGKHINTIMRAIAANRAINGIYYEYKQK